MSAICLPKPVGTVGRAILQALDECVVTAREDFGGTATAYIRLDIKDGLVLGLRRGVEGPTTRFRGDQ